MQNGALKGADTAACVSGHIDVLALVLFNNKHSHRDFIFDELTKVDALVSVKTFFFMDAVKMN